MTMNSCSLAGYLGKTPELRHTGNGVPVVSMRLGQSYSYHDAKTNTEQRKTNWFSVVGYGAVAEIAKTFQQGDNIVVDGQIEVREWEAADKGKRKVFEVIARNVGKLERNPDRNGAPQEPDGRDTGHDEDSPVV